jgi:alpha-1,3-rhamnosyl/mannosyltransferase
MKRIYVDGLGLVEGHFSGVGQYIFGILSGMDELLDRSSYTNAQMPKIIVIIPRDTVEKFKRFGFKHIGYKKFPLPFRYMAALWHRGWLPPIDLWCGRGTYIFPRFVDMPLAFSKSAVLVIFDLSYELHRQYSDEHNAQFLSEKVRHSIKNTNRVIAISQNARKEILDFYKLSPSKVVVATPAANQRLFYRRSSSEIDEIKHKYGIKGDYILALSNLEPRKNLSALVEAYCQLPKEITNKTSLLLVGVSGWKTDILFNDIVGRVEAGYNIIRPSRYVLDKDKPAIISGAKMLVYPSHYEGFGMPPLEAMACGTPIITSDNSSLPEVVGVVGKMIPSDDTKLLSQAIKEYCDNIEEITAKSIIEGPEQAQKFSWAESAKIFIDAAMETTK